MLLRLSTRFDEYMHVGIIVGYVNLINAKLEVDSTCRILRSDMLESKPAGLTVRRLAY